MLHDTNRLWRKTSVLCEKHPTATEHLGECGSFTVTFLINLVSANGAFPHCRGKKGGVVVAKTTSRRVRLGQRGKRQEESDGKGLVML